LESSIHSRFFGYALRLRWEWLRRTEPDRCWTALPAKMEKPTASMCAISMTATLGDGCSTLLWTDSCVPVGPLCKVIPELYAATSRSGKKRTVKDGVFQNRWAWPRGISLVRSPRRFFASFYKFGNYCMMWISILFKRIASCGNGHRMGSTPRHWPTALSSPVRRRYWGQRNYARQRRHPK
jgi:hypothetical protein